MSQQSKRYPADKALMNGSASTLDSACKKAEIIDELLKLRKENKEMKPVYEKADVLNKQLIQSRQDGDTKMKKIQAKTKRIKEMNLYIQKQDTEIEQQHTKICQLQNQLKLQKDTSVDKADNQRLEGFLKKKDQQIKELEAQIDSTKINHLEKLKNTIRQQNAQIKYLKEGYGKLNIVEDVILGKENQEKKVEPTEEEQSRADRANADKTHQIWKLEDENKKLKQDILDGWDKAWKQGKSDSKEENEKHNESLKLDLVNSKNEIENLKLELDNLHKNRNEMEDEIEKIKCAVTTLYDSL